MGAVVDPERVELPPSLRTAPAEAPFEAFSREPVGSREDRSTALARPVARVAPGAEISDVVSAGVPQAARTINWHDLFGHIIRWPCSDPCDWRPDIRIRVTQNQPGGTVEIYSDSYQQIHWTSPATCST